MKNYCCIVLGILAIIMIGLQTYTISKISSPLTPAPVTVMSPTPQSTLAIKPTDIPATPTPADDTLVYEVNNIAACSFTDRAEFKLDKNYFITRIRTWYSWEQGEDSTPYTLLSGDKEVATGTLVRKDCDPYQRQWCIAADFSFNKPLSSGEYVLKLTKNKICQNSGSKNKGFIYVWGK